MPSIGPTELVLVFLIALVVLGPKRLPEVGRQIGRMMREFRSATSQIRSEMGVDDLANDVRDIRSSIGVDDLTRDLTRDVDDVKQSLSVDSALGAPDPAAAEGPPVEPGQAATGSGTTPAARDEDQNEKSLTTTAGALFAVPSRPVDRPADAATPATASAAAAPSETNPPTPAPSPDPD